MCDFSLQAFRSRPAVVGDKLVTRNFGTGTIGFCSPQDPECAVCLTPGTEIAFDAPIVTAHWTYHGFVDRVTKECMVAKFGQIDKEYKHIHHDQLQFADGDALMLTTLVPGQRATVLQLPAVPKNEAEVEEQRRAEFVG